MRLLFDEQFQIAIVRHFSGFPCRTVHNLGWSGMTNGELLRLAPSVRDVFVTLDRGLEHQQKIASLPFGVVLVRSRSTRIVDLEPLVPSIVSAIQRVQPGSLEIANA